MQAGSNSGSRKNIEVAAARCSEVLELVFCRTHFTAAQSSRHEGCSLRKALKVRLLGERNLTEAARLGT